MIDVQKEAQPTIEMTTEFMSKMADVANVNAVFGQPIQRGDTIVIPCSEVSIGGGLGFGRGPATTNEQGKVAVGQGGGAGGGATGRPLAVIVMSPEGVRVNPIMDMTKVGLAVLSTTAFVLLWLGRLGRATKADKGKGPSLAQLRKTIQR
jgi:uncharacterized spore protein YtfJ